MQKNHARAIRGLSIASLVVSAVFIVCFIAGVIMMAFLGSFMDAELLSEYYSSDYLYGHGGYDLYDDYYGDAAALQMVFAMFDLSIWIFAMGIVLCVVTLIASIIVLRHSNEPQNYGKVFGWSIAAAIAGFLGSGMVLTILFIIIAVFADADKKLYQSGQYCATVAPTVPAQPMPPMQYGAGVPPYGAPQQGMPPYGAPQASAPQPSPHAAEPAAPSPQAQPFGAQASASQSELAAASVATAAAVQDAAQPVQATERASHESHSAQPIEVADAASQTSAVEPAAEAAPVADVEPATEAASAADMQGDGAGLAQGLDATDETTMVPLAEETIISNDGAGNITIEDAVISVDLGAVEAADDAGASAKDQ